MTPIRSLYGYVSRHRGCLFRIAVCSVGVTLAPAFSGRLIASAVDTARAGDLSASLVWIGGLLVAGAVGVWSLLRLSHWSAILTSRVQVDLTRDTVLHTLGDAVHSDRVLRSGAELTQHVPSLVDVLAHFLRLGPSGLFAIGSAAGLATLSWTLLVLALPWLVVAAFLQIVVVRAKVRNETASMLAEEDTHGETTRALQSVRDLVAAGAKGFAMDRVENRINRSVGASLRQYDHQAVGFGVVNAVATTLPALTALGFVPYLVRNDLLSAGEVVGSFTYLLAGLTAATAFVTYGLSKLVTLRVHHARLLASVGDGTVPVKGGEACMPPPRQPVLAVRDLTFAYGAGEPIVESFSLDLPSGDHLAIVGPSGIGKSTLAALLAGVLRPDNGTITVDGEPCFLRTDRTGLITMVPQEAYVFAGTLRENLVYLRPSASDEEIVASARAVGLDRVLNRLGGLDAEVNLTKSGLSEGERQLVTLARSHVAASPIIVLDEATCHLDPAAEERAERAFMALGRTLIVVAHRMAAARRAKRVLVMDGGGIDVGGHEELLDRHALYADFHGLWQQA
ncbi:MAG: ABC transporter ATP-binding protein [Gemmatimonadota bacterium]|nr:ABC transporter ATP-binding protein [Gemmatimonadota bacterium]